jgi:hypothetical protein
MRNAKDTARARVCVGYDGRVKKWFLGPQAEERYANEVRVLSYLARKACPFVPKIIEKNDSEKLVITTNCGQKVDQLSEGKCQALFDELESYGVRHRDQAVRNITYHDRLGRFCIIDFEFATILEKGYDPGPEMKAYPNRKDWKE